MAHPILQIKNLNANYGKLKILQDITFIIPQGKIVCLLGKNGAGKTTILKCVLGLIKDYRGNITINGINAKLSESRKYISYIPAEFYKLNNTTIKKFLFEQGQLYGLNKKKTTIKLKQICKDIGYPYKRISLKFNVLSSGLKKVIIIMQALLNPNIKLIIADEPTTNLDFETKDIFLNLIKRKCQKQKISFLFSTHSVNELKKVVDQFITLKEGKITKARRPN